MNNDIQPILDPERQERLLEYLKKAIDRIEDDAKRNIENSIINLELEAKKKLRGRSLD